MSAFLKPTVVCASWGLASAEAAVGEGADGGEPSATLAVFNPVAHLELSRQRRVLPVFGARARFLYAVETHGVVIVTAETGSGKSTQLPQYLAEAGWAQHGRAVCCTQPRRIAATMLAARVADERGCALGTEVGFAVRFEEQFRRGETKIKFVTDGLLLREAMSDPLLSAYSVVMVDEAHERSLQTDVLLGLLRRVRAARPALRVVVASATIDADRFARFFAASPVPPPPPVVLGARAPSRPFASASCVLSISGRSHPVDIQHLLTPQADYVAAAADAALLAHRREPPGDVLVFLPGAEEVEELLGLGVESLARFRYFEPPPATNMLRAVEDLAAVGALRSGAEEATGALGAGGEAGGGVRLSWRGRWLAQLPVSPALGAMLLASLDPALHCAEECLSLAAVLSAGDPVLPPAEASRQLDDAAAKSKRRGHGGRAGSGDDSEGDDGEAGLMSFHRFLAAEGDHLTLVNMYSAWDANGRRDDWCRGFGLRPHVMRRAGDVRALLHRSLRRLLDQAAASRADAAGRNPATAAASKAHAADEPPASLCIGSCGGDGSLVLQAAVRGSPTNLASLGRDGAYVTVRGGRAAKLRAHCVLSQLTGDASVPPWVLYDSVALSPSGQLMLGACSAVDPRWAVGAAGRAGLRLQEQDPTRARLAATIAEEAGDEGGELELDEAKLNAAIAFAAVDDDGSGQVPIGDFLAALEMAGAGQLSDLQVLAVLGRFGDSMKKGLIDTARFYATLGVEAPPGHVDPAAQFDELPEPFRTIDGAVQDIFHAAWAQIQRRERLPTLRQHLRSLPSLEASCVLSPAECDGPDAGGEDEGPHDPASAAAMSPRTAAASTEAPPAPDAVALDCMGRFAVAAMRDGRLIVASLSAAASGHQQGDALAVGAAAEGEQDALAAAVAARAGPGLAGLAGADGLGAQAGGAGASVPRVSVTMVTRVFAPGERVLRVVLPPVVCPPAADSAGDTRARGR
ncbi:hypothetical protein FNF27_07423 [Cafeteria roenbergensis]|uniref:RNA helicase n=2 Tax=Cafeteria roenbergensis TaxID=33653 RepID=A0A5A8DNN7_CAFRO|nr:hypothetical protein FNF27_07423 [Cafeteria roenbergensis]